MILRLPKRYLGSLCPVLLTQETAFRGETGTEAESLLLVDFRVVWIPLIQWLEASKGSRPGQLPLSLLAPEVKDHP